MLPGIGGFEYLFIIVLIIIFVAPKDLPSVVKGIGKLFGKIKKIVSEFRSAIDDMAKDTGVDELKESVNKANPINLTEEMTNSINDTIKGKNKTTDSTENKE
tara:strand:- start:1229 stop:1534 length:306 start_codon:yes stop_codon:yes gene_type:complete